MTFSVIGLIPQHLQSKRNIVKVEQCWNGGNRHSFRLTMPSGHRESVTGGAWTRQVASEALNIVEHVYGYDRRSVRFSHN